jgi:RimJ/RimL family protein N-acetyltransferase
VELVCRPENFRPFPDKRVRWLDWEADYPYARMAWQDSGIDLTYEEWNAAREEGYIYCGIIENAMLIGTAAVWIYSQPAWEVAAVRTMPLYRNRGLAKATISFVTGHIHRAGRLATCHTSRDNFAMIRAAQAVGFVLNPDRLS